MIYTFDLSILTRSGLLINDRPCHRLVAAFFVLREKYDSRYSRVFLTGLFPYEESRRGVYTGEVVRDLAWPQHPLDTVGPQFVPLSAVGVAQAQAHLLLFSIHRGGFLQSVFSKDRLT